MNVILFTTLAHTKKNYGFALTNNHLKAELLKKQLIVMKRSEIHTALTNAVRWPSICHSVCLSACRKTRGTRILYRPSTAATS